MCMRYCTKLLPVVAIGLALLAQPLRGEVLYMANGGGNNVSAYRIAANGTLTLVTGSPFSAGKGPVSVAALEPEESSEFNGQSVTDFGLQAHDGRMLDVRDFRGRPIIVEFFASSSSESRAQLTELIEIHDKYADQGLAIFALAVDPFETPETVKNVHLLIVTIRLPFPVGGATRELANDYHYKGVPETIVLDCEGSIARIFFTAVP